MQTEICHQHLFFEQFFFRLFPKIWLWKNWEYQTLPIHYSTKLWFISSNSCYVYLSFKIRRYSSTKSKKQLEMYEYLLIFKRYLPTIPNYTVLLFISIKNSSYMTKIDRSYDNKIVNNQVPSLTLAKGSARISMYQSPISYIYLIITKVYILDY